VGVFVGEDVGVFVGVAVVCCTVGTGVGELVGLEGDFEGDSEGGGLIGAPVGLAPILDRQFPKSVNAELPNSPPLDIKLTPSTSKEYDPWLVMVKT
jgi:hypothetical protein